jgi:hypothetical protein
MLSRSCYCAHVIVLMLLHSCYCSHVYYSYFCLVIALLVVTILVAQSSPVILLLLERDIVILFLFPIVEHSYWHCNNSEVSHSSFTVSLLFSLNSSECLKPTFCQRFLLPYHNLIPILHSPQLEGLNLPLVIPRDTPHINSQRCPVILTLRFYTTYTEGRSPTLQPFRKLRKAMMNCSEA